MTRFPSREDRPSPLHKDLEQVKQDFANWTPKVSDSVLLTKLGELYRNHQVYMFGGCDSYGNLYDSHLRRLRFTSYSGKLCFARVSVKSAYVPQPRVGHCLEFYLPAQMLILSGGKTRAGRFLRDLDIFDLGASTWQSVEVDLTGLCYERAFHSLTVVHDRVFIFGGINSEGYLSGSVLEFMIEDDKHPLRPKLIV